MKNKLRIGLSVLAVAIATGGVFASNAASVQPDDPTYDWITYDQSGNQTGTLNDKTQAEVEQLTNCQTVPTAICARAFDSNHQEVPNADLYFAQ